MNRNRNRGKSLRFTTEINEDELKLIYSSIPAGTELILDSVIKIYDPKTKRYAIDFVTRQR
jgi:hypothetical protein